MLQFPLLTQLTQGLLTDSRGLAATVILNGLPATLTAAPKLTANPVEFVSEGVLSDPFSLGMTPQQFLDVSSTKVFDTKFPAGI